MKYQNAKSIERVFGSFSLVSEEYCCSISDV